MRSVYKYPFEHPTMELELPRGAKVVHIGMQGPTTTMWIEVDVSANRETELRRFQIHGTGHPIIDSYGKHVGTTFDGSLVWHVYEY